MHRPTAPWPSSSGCRSMFPSMHRKCTDKLEAKKKDLFSEKNDDNWVLIKDVECNGQIQPHDLRSKEEVSDWLTRCRSLTTQKANEGLASRFVYCHGPSSRQQLYCTHDVFTSIAAANQVMPQYVDLLCDFGVRVQASNPASFAFRGHTQLASSSSFERGYELSYMLRNPDRRIAETRNPETTPTWSLRPLAIYHRFHSEDSRAFWLITRGDVELYKRKKTFLEDLARSPAKCSTSQDRFRASCATHLLFIHFALENWETYLDFLDNKKENTTAITTFGTRMKSPARKEFQVGDLGPIQDLQEEMNRAMLALEGNQRMLQAISNFYAELFAEDKATPTTECKEIALAFRQEIRQAELDFQVFYAKAMSMRDATSGRKELILQYLQGQTTERTEELTIETRNVALDSQHEAVIMRIITVVTLLFLPATFVSTFFSTDIWKFDDEDSVLGAYSGPAFRYWGAITGPLTLAVLITAGVFYLRSYYKKRHAKKRGLHDEEMGTLQPGFHRGRRSCLEAVVTCSFRPMKFGCSNETSEGTQGVAEKKLRLLPSDRAGTNRTGTYTTTLLYRNELTAEPQSV